MLEGAFFLFDFLGAVPQAAAVLNIRGLGTKGDSTAVDGNAIAAAAKASGGTAIFPSALWWCATQSC